MSASSSIQTWHGLFGGRFADSLGPARLASLIALLVCAAPPARATAPPLTHRVPAALAAASRAGLFGLEPHAAGLATQATTGTWRIPVILISFSDDTLRYSAADFERLLFDTTHAVPTGSVADYYAWASGGRLRLTGRVVATVKLPQTAAYYAAGGSGLLWYTTPQNDLGFARDALKPCQASVPWSEFDLNYDGYVDMLWLVHAGPGGEVGNPNWLWSITSRMAAGWAQSAPYVTTVGYPGTAGRYMLIDRFTVLPELSDLLSGLQSEIGVYCHEFGHALGLPDLYDVQNPSNTGPGNWSLMSTGAYGGDGHSPQFPVDMGAWPRRFLGWDRTLRPTRDTTITLGPLEQQPDIVDFWFQGYASAEHYLIERRSRIGYDRNLPGEGLVVYHVDEWTMAMGLASNQVNSGPTPGLAIVEGDADDDLRQGHNHGDASDPFPGQLGITRFDDLSTPSAHAILGGYTNIALEDITPIGTATRFRARVHATGWLAPEDHTGSGYAPVPGRSPARASGRDPAGVDYVVGSSYVGGHPQVTLRTSAAWEQPILLSQTTSAALEPSLAVLPDGDLAVVWSDSRHGRFELYCRSRIRGAWTPERPIVSLPGDCQSPSISNDARGGLYLAFQYHHLDTLRLMFERVNYVNPVGQPVVVSPEWLRPEDPVVVVRPDGFGYVLCRDRRPAGQLWFASFSPDSGVRPLQSLSTGTANQSNYAATFDSAGTLNVVWHVSALGVNEIRYQQRGGRARLEPVEGTLESLSGPIDALALATDGQNSVHVAYGLNGPNGVSLRYQRCWPDGVWDIGSTDLSYPGDYLGQQPTLLPSRDGNVSIAYTGALGSVSRFMIRRRIFTPNAVVAGTSASPHASASPPRLGPNPARAGSSIVVEGRAALETSSTLDVFDLGGRRVASLPIRRIDSGWQAEIPGTDTARWTSGVYFARPREGPAPSARFVIVR